MSAFADPRGDILLRGTDAMRWLLLLLPLSLVGCLQTRQSSSMNVTTVGVGAGHAAITSQGSFQENRWTGPGLPPE
jgi:hypothetical protein